VEELRHDREVRLQRRLGLGRCGLTLARRRTPQDHIFFGIFQFVFCYRKISIGPWYTRESRHFVALSCTDSLSTQFPYRLGPTKNVLTYRLGSTKI
jgi:hypothetical protein